MKIRRLWMFCAVGLLLSGCADTPKETTAAETPGITIELDETESSAELADTTTVAAVTEPGTTEPETTKAPAEVMAPVQEETAPDSDVPPVFIVPESEVWIEAGDALVEEQLNLFEKTQTVDIFGEQGSLLIYSYAERDEDGYPGFDDSGEWAAVMELGEKKYVLMPTRQLFMTELSGILYQDIKQNWHALVTISGSDRGYVHYDYIYDEGRNAFKLNYEVHIDTINNGHKTSYFYVGR